MHRDNTVQSNRNGAKTLQTMFIRAHSLQSLSWLFATEQIHSQP